MLRWRLNVVANVGTHATSVFLLRFVATSALAIHYNQTKHRGYNCNTVSKMLDCLCANTDIGGKFGTTKCPQQSRKWGEEASLQTSSTKSSVRCLLPPPIFTFIGRYSISLRRPGVHFHLLCCARATMRHLGEADFCCMCLVSCHGDSTHYVTPMAS